MRPVAPGAVVLARVVVILMFFAQTLAAQSGLRHRGFTAAVGLGAGSAALRCSSCTGRLKSQSGFLRLGYAFDSTVAVSMQVRAWQKSSTDETDTFAFFLAGVQYYPIPGKRLYLEGDIGSGRIALTPQSTANPKTTALASAIAGGVGYDFRLSRGFAVTPFLHAMTTSAGHPRINGIEANANLSGNLVQLGVALTWQQFTRRRYIPTGER